MTLAVRLRPEAELDVRDAASWYEAQLPGLGHQFLDELTTTLSSAADSPLMYPAVHRRIRRALVHRFPFGVYYVVEDSFIVILAVMHGSRHPRRWKSRT
jgi:plasmid stabilization system protein ParE